MAGPGVFGVPHLSEDAVAAFADGVLSASAAARARRHCAECDECAAAVRGQREAAMLLRSAQVPSLPSGLLARLTGLPLSAPLPPSNRGLPTAIGPDGAPVLLASSEPAARERSAAETGSADDDLSQQSGATHHPGEPTSTSGRRRGERKLRDRTTAEPRYDEPDAGAQQFFGALARTVDVRPGR